MTQASLAFPRGSGDMVGNEDFLARCILQQDCSVLLVIKNLRGDLTTIKKSQREPVRKIGTELLHQIECKRRATRTVAVKEAALRIKAERFESRPAVVHEQDVEK